jgi:hypothetical protein
MASTTRRNTGWFQPSVPRFTLAVALVMVAVSMFWSYRVRAAEEAAQFAPTRIIHVVLPAGTALKAAIKNGIASSAKPGDIVTAFVSKPILVDSEPSVFADGQLKGTLQKWSISERTGKAWISFTLLQTRGGSVAIHTKPVVVMTPVISDVKILRTALRTFVGVAFGIAMGAGSGDVRLIDYGVIVGTGVSMPVDATVPITVILIGDVEI